MFEAYAVRVRISLINGVTSGLMNISRAFAKTHGDAKALQRQLDAIQFKLMAGAALTGTGLFGLGMIGKTVPAAREYAHQLNIMNMAGLKQAEIAEAVGAAWKNTNVVVTTTATQNLRSLLDLRNVLGSMADAKWALPIVSKIGAAMGASSEGAVRDHADDIAFSMAKALDIIGAARDPATFAREAGMMSKVVTAFQNRVTPRQFQSVFQYARQAKFDLSDEFKYEFLPSLMLEMASGANSAGGGSRGVGPMMAAIYRVTNQGYVSKKAIPLLDRLGLLTSHDYARTTTPGTVGAQLKGKELAAQNPFLWSQQVLVPAIQKMLGPGATPQQVRGVINSVFAGNQLAASAMTEFYSKPQNFLRDQKIIQGAMPYGAAYQAAIKNDPETMNLALHAQWTNVKTQLGLQVLPMLIAGTIRLTGALRMLSNWMGEHPDLTRGLVISFTVLAGALAFGGSVILLSAAFDGLKLAFTVFRLVALLPMIGTMIAAMAPIAVALAPALLCVAALTALGVALFEIVKHWDSTKGIFWNIKHEFGLFFDWLLGMVRGLFPGTGKPVTHAPAAGARPDGYGAHGQRITHGVVAAPAYQPDRRDPWHHGGGSPFVGARPQAQKQSNVTGVYIDGKLVGHAIIPHMSDALDRTANTGSSDFDGGMTLTPVGYRAA